MNEEIKDNISLEAFATDVPESAKMVRPSRKSNEVLVKPDTETVLELKGCCQSFTNDGETVDIVKDISFKIVGNQVVALLGPSGCGKSTILRMISGMHPRDTVMPTMGECYLNGLLTDGPRDETLTIWQTPVLSNWLTVLGNVKLSFKPGIWHRKRWPWEVAQDAIADMLHLIPWFRGKIHHCPMTHEINLRAKAMIQAVSMENMLYHWPSKLSGGEAQRIGLATDMVVRPRVVCADEPYSKLEPAIRIDLQDVTMELIKQFPCLYVMVTHDVSEALKMADRIIVLSAKPAHILADIELPKGRPAEWMLSPEKAELENRILQILKEAKGNGQVRVSV